MLIVFVVVVPKILTREKEYKHSKTRLPMEEYIDKERKFCVTRENKSLVPFYSRSRMSDATKLFASAIISSGS